MVRSLQELCAVIQAEPDDVLNVYELGSSGLPGATLTAASDVDCVVILKPSAARKWKNANWLLQHGWCWWEETVQQECPFLKDKQFRRDYRGHKEYDIWMYDEATFAFLLQQAAPFAVECLFVPRVWKKASPIDFTLQDTSRDTLVRSYLAVSFLHLRRAGLEFTAHHHDNDNDRASSNKQVSLLRIEPWDLYKSQKALYFALRLLALGRQLIETGNITDRNSRSMQTWRQQLVDVPGDAWEDYMDVFQPLHAQLLVPPFDQTPPPEILNIGHLWCRCSKCLLWMNESETQQQ